MLAVMNVTRRLRRTIKVETGVERLTKEVVIWHQSLSGYGVMKLRQRIDYGMQRPIIIIIIIIILISSPAFGPSIAITLHYKLVGDMQRP